jgi:hypothetical protein
MQGSSHYAKSPTHSLTGEIKASCRIVACASMWFGGSRHVLYSLRCRFYGHLPRRLIDLNSSMNTLPW